MPVRERTTAPRLGDRWIPRLLRLYPRSWRDRYEDEVAELLAEHRVTLWTCLDILLGALDAHLHADLLPGRLTSMAHRIRTSVIAIFCAFVLFCVAWAPLTLVRDPLPVWESAVRAHPELLTALNLLDVAGLVATLAVLVGGVPVLVAAVAWAWRARRKRQLLLFATPLLAVILLVFFAAVAIPLSGARQSSAPNAPLTPLAIVLQICLTLLLLVAVGGSTAALALAVAHSEVETRLLRFALRSAAVATTALAGGLLASLTLTALIFAEAPQVSFWPPLHAVDLLLMLAAVALASFGLSRGIQATRSPAGATGSQ